MSSFDLDHSTRATSFSIRRKPIRNASSTSTHIALTEIVQESHTPSSTPEKAQTVSRAPFIPAQQIPRPEPSNEETYDGPLAALETEALLLPFDDESSSSHAVSGFEENSERCDEIEDEHNNYLAAVDSKQPGKVVEPVNEIQKGDGFDESKTSPLPLEDLPDWRPSSLSWAPHIAILIFLSLVVYIVLYLRSKYWGVIASSESRWDWVFRFGPAFLAVTIREVLLRIATDLQSVLPYIALSSGPSDHIRWRPLARLTEPRWYDGFHFDHVFQATVFLIRYCTFVFVPLQSSLLSYGNRHYKTSSSPFRVVQPNDLISSLSQSRVPALALNSVWHGQPVADIKWLTIMPQASVVKRYMAIQPDYAGVMPFRTEHEKSSSYVSERETWKLMTSAIYGYLNCSQIDSITLTVNNIWLGASGLEIDRLALSLIDKEDCTFNHTWTNISSNSLLDTYNPITSDGKFALWQTLDGYGKLDKAGSNCLPHKHFIASGPMTVPYTMNDDNETNTGYVGRGSGWAALSCVPAYHLVEDNITYTMDPESSKAGEHTDVHFGDGTRLSLDDDRLNRPLKKNFLANSLVYNLSSPVFRRTFWNARLPNAFSSLQDTYSEWYDEFDVEGCQSVSTEFNVWNNNDACQMYANVATLWPLLVAGTVSLSALYLPFDDQTTKMGTLTTFRKGWYLTGWELIYTTLLHVFLFWLVTRERTLHLDRLIPQFIRHRFKDKLRSRYRTGLYGTASSIAGRAYVFRDESLRPLFDRLDTMKPSQAIMESRRRLELAKFKLLLRIWQIEPAEGTKDPSTTNAMIRPSKALKDFEELKEPEAVGLQRLLRKLAQVLQSLREKVRLRKSANRAARRLEYGQVPGFLHPLLLVSIFTGIIVIVGVVYQYIIRSKSSGFQMWFQPTYTLSQGFRDEVKRYLQKAMFKGLPALILLSLGYWWEAVERYYRTTEPYVALANGAAGQISVCLDYVHSFHIVTAFKAAHNGHFYLSYVTYTTFAVKLCIVLASGIFSMNEIGHTPGRDLALSRNWRVSNFVDNVHEEFKVSLRSFAISRAVFGYPSRAGWGASSTQGSSWVFPSVHLDGPQFEMNLTGITGSLSCQSVDTMFTWKAGRLTAVIDEGHCNGSTWTNICQPPADDIFTRSPENSRRSCMLWRYLNDSKCGQAPAVTSGRWWIISVNGTTDLPSSSGSITKHLSLICEPQIWTGNTFISLYQEQDEVSIAGFRADAVQLPADHWTGTTNKSVDLVTYTSQILNETFTGELYPTSDEGWLDHFSLITVLGSKRGTDVFFNNSTALATAVSATYSHVFSALISKNLQGNETDESSTILLETLPTGPGAAPPPTVPVSPLANMATVARTPLKFAMVVLIMYCTAVLFVWPSRKRRMPLDISYPANAMTMVYDSTLLDIIRESGETRDFKILHNMQFAIGSYKGVTGKTRLGIDVKNQVTDIGGGRKEDSFS